MREGKQRQMCAMCGGIKIFRAVGFFLFFFQKGEPFKEVSGNCPTNPKTVSQKHPSLMLAGRLINLQVMFRGLAIAGITKHYTVGKHRSLIETQHFN
jgi:hypothetical protein